MKTRFVFLSVLVLFFCNTVFSAPQIEGTGKEIFTSSHVLLAKPRGLVILLPGLFNRILPAAPYAHLKGYPSSKISRVFAQVIIDELTKANLDILAFEPFNWSASIGDISHQVADRIQSYYSSIYPEKNMPIYFVGHSAGGLVALKVSEFLGKDLPIKKVITLATPYHGSPIATYLANAQQQAKFLRWLDNVTGQMFDLSGIAYVSKRNVRDFLQQLELPAGISVQAFGGLQERNAYLLPSRKAQYLSQMFVPLQLYMPKDSDGIVDLPSALGSQISLFTEGGGNLRVKGESEHIVPLDHAELIIDNRTLQKFLPISNPEYISQNQAKFFAYLAKEQLK